MKKILSLFCVLALAIGANAVEMRQHAPKAAQANAWNFAIAWSMHSSDNFGEGDWWIDVTAPGDEDPQFRFDITSKSDTTIAGVYQIGTPYASFYYTNYKEDEYKKVTGGTLTITLIGDTTIAMGENSGAVPLYEMKAVNLVIEGSGTVSLTGRVAVLACDMKKYIAFNKGDSTDPYVVILKDKAGSSSNDVVTVNLTSDLYLRDYTTTADSYGQKGYWYFGGSDGTYEACVVLQANAIAGNYSSVLIDEEGGLTSLTKNGLPIDIKSGFGTATVSGDDVNFNFYLQGSDGVTYNVILNTTGGDDPVEDPYEDDEAYVPFNATYTMNQTKIDTDNFAQYGVIFVSAQTTTDGVDLGFYVNSMDSQIGLPAGTYPINASNAAPSLHASDGLYLANDGNYYYDESFAYTYANQQYTDVWFLASGTATVTKNNNQLGIVITGKNTKGQDINITIGNPTTALGETVADDAQTEKTMENGQLIIRRNGVRYNAQGAVIE